MSGIKVDLKTFKEQNVKLTLIKGGEALYGKVVDAMRGGLVLKYKGSPRAVLIEAFEIQDIELDTQLVDIKASQLQWPKLSTVRKHLATHHGYGLSTVNNMTNEQSLKAHDEIHDSDIAYDLGHYHPGSLTEPPSEDGTDESKNI